MRTVQFLLAVILLLTLAAPARAGHEVSRWRYGHRGAVSVTFDDGLYSHATVAAELLDQRKLLGTFFILADDTWNQWGTYWEDWRSVAFRGHEIGSHTLSHADLPALSEAALRFELEQSRFVIEQQVPTQDCLSLAYPFGSYDDLVEQVAADYYIGARTVWSPLYLNFYPGDPYEAMDPFAVGSFAFDWPDVTDLGTLLGHLDAAEQHGAWYMPHIHALDDPEPVEVLVGFLDALPSRDLWVAPFGTVLRYWQERVETTVTVVSQGASSIVLAVTSPLDPAVWNVPLTLRSTVPASWAAVGVLQGGVLDVVETEQEGGETVAYYDVVPGGGTITLTPESVVEPPPVPATLELRVAANNDDAEEAAAGAVYLNSSDLELVNDTWNNAGNQTVGLRFQGVTIPQGATVTAAWLRFKVDETGSSATSLKLRGHDTDNAAAFAASAGNLSLRATTTASATWAPAAWTVVGQEGALQQTPDLSAVVQEIVNRDGWSTGHAMVFLITGTGRRTAEARDGDAAGAALLHVEYTTGPAPNKAPVVDAGLDAELFLPDQSLLLLGTVADDGLPVGGSLSPLWTVVSGPAGVQFTSPAALSTVVNFPGTGTWVLQLAVSDGVLTGADALTVVVAENVTYGSLDVRVKAGADDAEEAAAGVVYLDSSDLELVNDTYNNAGNQTVGLRFQTLDIPKGAHIIAAWVQFTTDETGSGACALTVRGHAVDQAPAFTSASKNLSSRAQTAAQVSWSPAAWTTVGQAAAAQRTPDLSKVVQEIVSRPGWAPGNSMALVIQGTGRRTAEARESGSSTAPLLHVEYSVAKTPARSPVPRF